jgi:hypothetical protein
VRGDRSLPWQGDAIIDIGVSKQLPIYFQATDGQYMDILADIAMAHQMQNATGARLLTV